MFLGRNFCSVRDDSWPIRSISDRFVARDISVESKAGRRDKLVIEKHAAQELEGSSSFVDILNQGVNYTLQERH